MNMREISPEFTVYVYARDVEPGAAVKVGLARAGYDAHFFESSDSLLERVAAKAPHVVVFPTLSLTMGLSDFIEKILKLNGEIRFVLIAHTSQFETLSAYSDYGLVGIVADDAVALPERVQWTVDRACERLYLTYQNEQLLERVRRAEMAPVVPAQPPGSSFPVAERIADYGMAESKEELLQRYLIHWGDRRALFLKYLPSLASFVVTHASQIPSDSFQGVGCRLEGPEAKDLAVQLSLGVVPPSLAHLLKSAFQIEAPRLRSVMVSGRLEGVIASATASSEVETALSEEFALFSLAYTARALEKKIEALEVSDPVTEVYNRQFYFNRLQEEVSRARRIRQPISVVKLALDDFFELEQSLGEAARDQILKNLAQLIHKTSRTNDFTCRSGMNEFALILPHCNRQGAMIRAERLRRIVAGTQMMENGLKISVSLGISEYPTLCTTAEALDESSTKALAHIQDKGGNKLCLSKAPSDHVPDFAVPVESTG